MGWVYIVVGVVVFVVLHIIITGFLDRRTSEALGPVECFLDKDEARCGGELTASIKIRPVKDLSITWFRIQLNGYKWTQQREMPGAKSNNNILTGGIKTSSKVSYSEKAQKKVDLVKAGGEEGFDVVFQVPEDAQISKEYEEKMSEREDVRRGFSWEVEFVLETKGYRRSKQRKPIVVKPRAVGEEMADLSP